MLKASISLIKCYLHDLNESSNNEMYIKTPLIFLNSLKSYNKKRREISFIMRNILTKKN